MIFSQPFTAAGGLFESQRRRKTGLSATLVAAHPPESCLFISSSDFLQGSPGISTCNAVRRTAQTDEVAAVWPFASAKRGARHLRTKCLLEDWNTAEALGNDIKGHVLWKLSTLRGCVLFFF